MKKVKLGYLKLTLMLLFLGSLGVIGFKHIRSKYVAKKSDVFAVYGISPASGSAGTTVIITGKGFETSAEGNVVTFNDLRAVVNVATREALIVTVPLNAGTGDVKVRVGTGTAILPGFKYWHKEK